jgi:DNA-binding response OmpR family regulator
MSKSAVIVEDDFEIRNTLTDIFSLHGYDVTAYSNGSDFKDQHKKKVPSCYLVDWKLPDTEGTDLIQHIRLNDAISPVFLMTASREEEISIKSLINGADHFIRKPFNMDELLTRFDNATKKLAGLEANLMNTGLRLIPEAQTVIKNGVVVRLTNREFKILECLIQSNEVVTRRQLIEAFQMDADALTERHIDVHIFSLRKKVCRLGLIINTVWGTGYKLTEE